MVAEVRKMFPRFRSLLAGAILLSLPLLIIRSAIAREGSPADIKVGYGWSTQYDENDAVDEALRAVEKNLEPKKAACVFLFSSGQHDPAKVHTRARQRLGSSARICGGTSQNGIMTKDGVHTGERGSVGIMAVSSDDMHFGIGGADLNIVSSREAGRLSISSAIKDAGIDAGSKPAIVLIVASPAAFMDEVIKGIADVVGSGVPITGGNASSDPGGARMCEYANDKVYYNGLSVAAVYTDLKVGHSMLTKHGSVIREGMITRASGSTLYEIDDRPAAEVYNEWLDGYLAETLKDGGFIDTDKMGPYALSKAVKNKDGSKNFINIFPTSVILPEKALHVGFAVASGDSIQLTLGDSGSFLKRAEETVSDAIKRGGFSIGSAKFGLYFLCTNDMVHIPKDQLDSIARLVYSESKAPFIGIFSFGEYGCVPGSGNVNSAQANSFVLVSDERR